MSLIKAVLLDLDGTLVDTAPDFVVTVNQLLRQHGRDEIASERIRKSVSQGARALVTLAFQREEGAEGFEDLRQQLLDLYEKNLSCASTLFPGIYEFLQQLQAHDIAWGIVTNKPSRFTMPLMALTKLPCPPSTVICPDHVSVPKPDPEALQLACRELGCKASEAIYIGDHRRDIECGRNAGMETIAAAYGYIGDGDSAESWNASYLVEHPKELWAIINTKRH